MKQRLSIAVASALSIVSASCFSAGLEPTVITFGEADSYIGNHGPIVEDDYQYNALGESWSLQNGGLPDPVAPFPHGSALVTFWRSPPAVGNVIWFSRLDGRPFSFVSLELRGRLDGPGNDVVLARGLLDRAEVASQFFQSSNAAWRIEPANSSFAAAIDELQFVLVEYNRSTLIFDNVTLALVPEPSACVLLALGVPALPWVQRRRVTWHSCLTN